MPASVPADVRVEFGDDLFLRRHRGLGSPVVNQLVWRFPGPLPLRDAESFRDELSAGSLSRTARRSLVPGSRDRWVHSGHRPPVVRATESLSAGSLLAWLRDRAGTPLDPHRGHSWELSYAEVSDAGSVLSLVVAHAAADGGAMVDAVERAAARTPVALPAPAGRVRTLTRDLLDSAGQVRSLGTWATRRLSRLPDPAPAPPAVPAPASPVTTHDAWETPLVVVELDTVAMEAAASTHGGSGNAWFVAVAAGLVRSLGRFTPGSTIPVAVPVSTRTPGDTRANATRIAKVHVTAEDLESRDLARVRSHLRAAYADLAATGPLSSPVPLPLVQMLPDAVVRRIPPPPAQAALASNLGRLSDEFRRISGHEARSVAAIAHYVRADQTEVRAMGGGLAAWLSTSARRTTLAVAGMEPDRLTGEGALRDLLLAELARWDVAAEPW